MDAKALNAQLEGSTLWGERLRIQADLGLHSGCQRCLAKIGYNNPQLLLVAESLTNDCDAAAQGLQAATAALPSQSPPNQIPAALQYRPLELDGKTVLAQLLPVNATLSGLTLPSGAAMAMARDICRQLAALQAAGLIFHDVKADNIFYSDQDGYQLAGFACCEPLAQAAGKFTGSGRYAPPEAWNGVYDDSSDCYSLGLYLYEQLNCGLPPYLENRHLTPELLREAVNRRLSGAELPVLPLLHLKKAMRDAINAILRRACAPQPEQRYANASEMLAELDEYMQAQSPAANAFLARISKDAADTQALSTVWKLRQALGSGSFGAVYRAEKRNAVPPQSCALKIVAIPKDDDRAKDVMHDLGLSQKGLQNYYAPFVAKSMEEAQNNLKLASYPEIVHITESAYALKPNGLGYYFWMAMELLNPIDSCCTNQYQAARIGLDICRALTAAHKNNFYHRDVKPDNIFFSSVSGYKLGDLGVSKQHEDNMNITLTGTPIFMAPEMLNAWARAHENAALAGNKPSKYTADGIHKNIDLYSLGASLYLMLNDNFIPFMSRDNPTQDEKNSAQARRIKMPAEGQAAEPWPPARLASPELMAIIAKACQYWPEDRYQTAEEMAADLLKFLQDNGEEAAL